MRAGETARAGRCGGVDEWADGGGGSVDSTGCAPCAKSCFVRSLRAAGTNGIPCSACPHTSLLGLFTLATPSSRLVRKLTHFQR